MVIKYQIRYQEAVIHSHIPRLPLIMKKRIKTAIEERLAIDPISFGKPLRYSLKNLRRLRVGDYRIIYKIVPTDQLVLIIAIKHRKEVYENHC